MVSPLGYRHTFIVVAYLKRALRDGGTPADLQLRMLEGMSGWVDLYFSGGALAAIEPFNDDALKIVHEARKADDHGDTVKDRNSFEILTSVEVFSLLEHLNPSFATAEALCG